MIVTVQMNAMGHLHVWEGRGVPQKVAKYNWTMKGREADLYLQVDTDVESFLADLPASAVADIEAGWHRTARISDDYALLFDKEGCS